MFGRRKHEVEESQLRIEDAEARVAFAEVENRTHRQLAQHTHTIVEQLRREVDKNHFTEMLLQAWGAR